MRCRRLEQREDLRQPWRLHGAEHHGVGRRLQLLQAYPTAVLDHHAHAVGVADAAHGWRRDNEHEPFLDGGELLEQRALQRRLRLARILCALVEGIEREEDGARIGCVGEGRAREADDVDRVRHARHLQRDIDHLAVDLIRARQRRARRQLHDGDEIARVLLRNEARRRLVELVEAVGEDRGIGDEHQRRDAHDARGEAPVPVREAVEGHVEIAEETAHRPRPPAHGVPRIVRLQQQGAHGRRQGQRHEQ